MFRHEYETGQGKQRKTVVKVVAWPTGYTVLPYDGGVLDQPYRLMEWFDAFMSGEKKNAYLQLKD
jgi:hypothetical protein